MNTEYKTDVGRYTISFTPVTDGYLVKISNSIDGTVLLDDMINGYSMSQLEFIITQARSVKETGTEDYV